VPSLRALLESRHDVAAVLTRPDRPAGRGRHVQQSPVAALAREVGIETLTPTRLRDPQFQDRLRALAPDCCPVVAYGALIPAAALDIPRHGWVNLHFSVLPAWRGAAPVQAAVLHGDEIVGASTFQIEEGLDTGPVYGVVTEPARPRDTAGDVLDRLAVSGARLLVATLDGIEDGALTPRPQPPEGVSTAPKITVDDARIDWSAPAARVDRLARACTPEPGAWTTYRRHRVELAPVLPLPAAAPAPRTAGAAVEPGEPGGHSGMDPRLAEAPRRALAPGELLVEKRRVLVGTGTTPVCLGDVRPEGRRAMPAADWARGVRPERGDRFD
jgi:methionyl-tRNA formyltransferase